MLTPLDRERLQEALALAAEAIGRCDPNPRVGCVIGTADGQVWATGSTQAPGSAHAEAQALARAHDQGLDLRGATAWVTLEPCAHHGRTPPCADALVNAGLARVVVGSMDPFPQVNGQGLERLRAAGMQVDVCGSDDPLAQACRDLNIGFFSRFERGRPWLRMKVAASLDGRTALPNGTSQWITQSPARADGHAWRKRAGAVVSGIGTVLEDNPRLDVREVPTQQQPLRVIVDSKLQTPPQAKVLAPPGKVLIYAAQVSAASLGALQDQGAEVVVLPGPQGKVDLNALVQDLGQRHINEVHIEAGHKLNGSLLKAGLVDELLVYMAPMLLGEGREMAQLGALTRLDEAWKWDKWEFTDVARIGTDLRLRLKRL
jgi:diaminohydroxyphosphoribosylaminopyrimidine deaminase/5-amino-6-(5-phosphoribosylamino)uracil reductase